MLVQPLKLVTTQANNFRTLVIRNYTNNPISFLVRKFNKLYHGSETPRKPVDQVREMMIKEGQYKLYSLPISKLLYLREKSRKRYVIHNKRIRKLEEKITGGVYQTKGLANKF